MGVLAFTFLDLLAGVVWAVPLGLVARLALVAEVAARLHHGAEHVVRELDAALVEVAPRPVLARAFVAWLRALSVAICAAVPTPDAAAVFALGIPQRLQMSRDSSAEPSY